MTQQKTEQISLDNTIRSVFGEDAARSCDDFESEQIYTDKEGISISYFPESKTAMIDFYNDVSGSTVGEASATFRVMAERIAFLEQRGYVKTEYCDREDSSFLSRMEVGAEFKKIPIRTQSDLDAICAVVKEARDSIR